MKRATPYYWLTDASWNTNLRTLDEASVLADENVRSALGVKSGRQELRSGEEDDDEMFIDELAILVPSLEMAMALIGDAVGREWVYTNHSKDDVRTEPLNTEYRVRYHFLTSPSRYYRLEIMHLSNGFSPLHHSMDYMGSARYRSDAFPIVHASFKPLASGEARYEDAQRKLAEARYVNAQECRSTYGRFSYWRRTDDERLLYLKPRVNLRDEVGEAIGRHFSEAGGQA